jgi:hypothetical protein
LYKKFQESEHQRLELISQTNRDSFTLNSQFSKLRCDYEKSQAGREELEYQLAMTKNCLSKAKQASTERDAFCKEVNKKLEGKRFVFYLFVILF